MEELYQDKDTDIASIINSLPSIVFWKDLNSRFRGCNVAFLKFMGLHSYHQIVGKTDHDFTRLKAHAAEELRIDQAVIKAATAMVNRDAAFFDNANNKTVMAISKRPLYDHYQNVIGILGVMTDVTQARKLEEDLISAKQHAETANQAKTEFLATMSHDLRTPLNGVIGLSEMLEMKLEDEEHKRLMNDILSASKQLLSLVEEILDLSSIEAGQLALAPKRFNLKELIASVITNYQAQRRPNPLITVTYAYPEALDQGYISDPYRLTQIISNLLGNAYKFTMYGEISVNVNCLEQDHEKAKLAISVRDTGVGIPSDRLDNVFGKFTQINPSYRSNCSGVGLGLAIVKRLIKAFDGEIQTHSSVGKGSEFIAILTLKKQKAELVDINANKRKRLNMVKKGTKVLVVEDNLINQRFFKMALDHLNCETTMTCSARQAIDAFDNSYDLVLLDIGLPDQDGYTVAQQLIQRMDGFIPIVAVTAHVLEEDKARCFEVGMADVVTKPVSSSKLKEIIAQYTTTKSETRRKRSSGTEAA